jgi:hypothetical protein
MSSLQAELSRVRIPLLAISIALSAIAIHGACPLPSYVAPPVYPAGLSPTTVASANINGDGIPDLVVGNATGSGVAVLLGNAGGSFQLPAFAATTASVLSIAVADFNGDRLDDAAVFDPRSRSVIILMNHGGQLSAATPTYPIAVGQGAKLVAGDFNGDGRPDLVLVCLGTQLTVLTGNGDGTFATRSITLSAKTFLRGGAAVGDLNKDGRDDLALTEDQSGSGGDVLLLMGDASVVLQDPVAFAFTDRTSYVSIADFDGDGALDVAATFLTRGRLGLVLAAGLPGAKSSYSADGITSGGFPLIVADSDGDGILDFATYLSNQVVVRKGLGSLRFSVGVPMMALSGSSTTEGIALDTDHDGQPDLVLAMPDGIAVIRNLGNGRFDSPSAVGAVAVGDFNGDGRTDLLDWKDDKVGDGLIARLATPGGAFESRRTADGVPTNASFKIIDVNGDGKLDFVGFESFFEGSSSNRVFVGLGRGDGTFNFLTPINVGRDITSGSVADFDGDGRFDIVVGNGDSLPGHRAGVTIAMGRGDGTFGTPTDLDLGVFAAVVSTGDFDGNGRPDLLILGYNAVPSVALNDGSGHFRTPVAVSYFPQLFAVADLDRDGKDDLVAAYTLGGPARVRMFFSRGDGSFDSGDEYSVSSTQVSSFSISFPDLNSDGKPDVAVGISESPGGSHLIPLINQGGRRFVQTAPLRTSGGGAFGDFDGNGSIDLMDGLFPRLSLCSVPTFRHRAVGH